MKNIQSNSKLFGFRIIDVNKLTKTEKRLLDKIKVASLATLLLSIPSIARADFNTSPPSTDSGLTSVLNCQTSNLDFVTNWTLTNTPTPDKIVSINDMYLEYSNFALNRFNYRLSSPRSSESNQGETSFDSSYKNSRRYVDIIEGTITTFEVQKNIPLNEVGCIIE